jgi:hypothetical protein
MLPGMSVSINIEKISSGRPPIVAKILQLVNQDLKGDKAVFDEIRDTIPLDYNFEDNID